MEKYLPQMIHVDARKSEKTSQFQTKTFCPDPVPLFTRPLLDRPCWTDFAEILLKTQKSILNKFTKFQIATPNRLGARIEKNTGAESTPKEIDLKGQYPIKTSSNTIKT